MNSGSAGGGGSTSSASASSLFSASTSTAAGGTGAFATAGETTVSPTSIEGDCEGAGEGGASGGASCPLAFTMERFNLKSGCSLSAFGSSPLALAAKRCSSVKKSASPTSGMPCTAPDETGGSLGPTMVDVGPRLGGEPGTFLGAAPADGGSIRSAVLTGSPSSGAGMVTSNGSTPLAGNLTGSSARRPFAGGLAAAGSVSGRRWTTPAFVGVASLETPVATPTWVRCSRRMNRSVLSVEVASGNSTSTPATSVSDGALGGMAGGGGGVGMRGRARSGAVAGGTQVSRCKVASKTSAQWPQRTQPSEILSWSGTTRNIVPQAGQRVV